MPPYSTNQSLSGLLTIVVPAFNEQEVLAAFHGRLAPVLGALEMDAEVLYVNMTQFHWC